MFRGDVAFSRDGEAAVVDVDIDVLLLEAWQLESCGHHVLLVVLVEVHPDKRLLVLPSTYVEMFSA